MSRRTFAIGIAVVLAVFVALGVLVDRLNGDRLRPEGVAEDWLVAVGDSTRKGVQAESRERAERIGPIALARPLLDKAGDTDGKRAFSDLEVGKSNNGRVPFRLHVRDADEPTDGVVVLQGTRVVGLDARRAGERVPSEGGPPPSSAPNWLWPLGLAAGLVITALASLAVRLATPRAVS